MAFIKINKRQTASYILFTDAYSKLISKEHKVLIKFKLNSIWFFLNDRASKNSFYLNAKALFVCLHLFEPM